MDTPPIMDKRVDTTTRNSMVARVEAMEVMGEVMEVVMEVVSDKTRMGADT